jgi:hypothetical protein
MRSIVISLLLLVALSMNSVTATSASAQAQASTQANVSADKSKANPLDVEFERLTEEGNVALYNLDYEKARNIYQQMTGQAPDQPAGYVYLANNLWLETLNRNRRLSSSLYNSASFYAQTAANDKVDPERDQQFNRFIKKALEVAEARLKKDPSDARSLYYKGAALGLRSAYSVTVKRSFFGAIGDAKKSVQAQNKVIKLDPNYADAYLSIGFYEYIVGSLPLGWRILASFVGIKGNKKKGTELLETVAERGKYAADDARVLLMGISMREGKFERALELAGYLANKYPRNYLLGIERAAMLYHLSRADEGARAFAGLLTDAHIAAVAADAVNYQYGEALTETRNYALAIERYKAVVEWPKSDQSLVTLAHLHEGQALDALGKRAEAVKAYQIALKRENVYDSRDLASQYLNKPYVPARR